MNDVEEMNRQLTNGAGKGDLDLMREALQNGADVNAHWNTAFVDWTPLTWACRHGGLEAVRFLSSVPGIDFNAVIRFGRSAFHCACLYGHLEVVRFLVTLPGHNLLHTDIIGNIGLHNAVILGHLPVVQYLLSSDLGFEVETTDIYLINRLCRLPAVSAAWKL